jgi:hypothetical protein
MTLEQSDAYVIAPSSAEEAAAVLREVCAAARSGVQVRAGVIGSPYVTYNPAGSPEPPGTGGIPPEISADGGTILLSHARMKDIIEISKPDLLAVAQGGARVSGLAAAAAEEGLRFPHRPEIDISVAEMVMEGAIFPTEGEFGGLREYILSLELVTPAGEIVRFGSRAIKDVGGYELIGFLLGQGGRCGFISSVTLRLLPEPSCRAFVAVTGEVRTLKALAHNARRDFRLSSTLIYEAEAAAIIAGIWNDALEKRGKTLPAVLEPGGEALLIGEMQGLEHVVEDQLHALAGTDAWGGASFALLDKELFEYSKDFLSLAYDRLDGRGSVVHMSYDGGETPPEGSIVYRSLYPERINALIPVRMAGTATSPIEIINADSKLRDFLSGLVGTLRRERAYIVGRDVDGFRKIRLSNEDLLGIMKGDDDRIARVKTMRALDERVIGAFDPESIMMP